MNHFKKTELDEKLKKMIVNFYDAKSKKDQRKHHVGKGNFIRRRRGEKDQRFSVCLESELFPVVSG